MSHSRNNMNEALTDLLFESLVAHVLTPERLVMEHAMLVAILHANVGTEVGEYLTLATVHSQALLTYLLTYSMVQSPSWEANWFAASQEIPRIFLEPQGLLLHSQASATCPCYRYMFQEIEDSFSSVRNKLFHLYTFSYVRRFSCVSLSLNLLSKYVVTGSYKL